MEMLNKYPNAASVEEALDKGLAAYSQAEENKTDISKVIDACCDTEISNGNYNLLKISEVSFSSRLQNDAEEIVSSTTSNVVTGWIPITYGKYYSISTYHSDLGYRTNYRSDFVRVQLKLADGTIKLYGAQMYPTTNNAYGVDDVNAVAMRVQLQIKSGSGSTQADISTADKLKAFEPMIVEGATPNEACNNSVNFEYLDGDIEVPYEVVYKLKSDDTKADKTDLDYLKNAYGSDTSMMYEAQKRISDDWRIPFVDVFHKIGLGSNHIIPNSYNVWGGTGNDLTQKAVMMEDGMHPHEGDGVVRMYANAIVPQLKAVPPLYSAGDEHDDWTGKAILWLGTSCPAGSDPALGSVGDGTNYPTITASKLGATCTNIARGSSCVRINSSAGNYENFGMHHILRSLSRTKAEADIVQANWDSIKVNVTSPTTTITDDDLATMKAHSFESLLLPYLDGTNPMPDLFVFDHGHNDMRPRGVDGKQDSLVKPTLENIRNGVLAEDTYMIENNYANLKIALNCDLSKIGDIENFVASLNRNCYIGATNFLITLIYRYNPRARIVIVSDYN